MVPSSANCRGVLIAAGINDRFARRIDDVAAERAQMKGKPAPATFLVGALAWVAGVDRTGQADALCPHDADVVGADLAELLRAT